MIAKLRDKIAEYVTNNSELTNWEEIRQNYAYYSYMAFLCLAAHDLDHNCDGNILYDTVEKYGLENQDIISFIKTIPDIDKFAAEIFEIADKTEKIDVNGLYQEYLSKDFLNDGNKIVFTGGKNNRDILGSYYTQEEFAYEITRKAIDDYCSDTSQISDIIKIADLSCGGGAFLVSAYTICMKKNIHAVFYGYDVDPIAVLITRFRFAKIMHGTEYNFHIILGNPLIRSDNEKNPIDMFKMASTGRFYNSIMGSMLKEEMDVVVGNPPWEKIRFEEKKFLSHYMDQIGTKAERERQLSLISEDNYKFYASVEADYDIAKKSIKKDSHFKLSGCGELNTYALFTELCMRIIKNNGIVGLIVKSSLVKIPVYSDFFRKITSERSLYELYMFVNRKKIFNIDSREEFSVVFLHGNRTKSLKLALNIDEFENFINRPKIEVSYELLNILNPETGMVPNIKCNEELQFLKNIYCGRQPFGKLYPKCRFGRLVHLTNHSQYIRKEENRDYDPIYEGKFIELYTGKFATFEGVDEEEKYKNKASAIVINDVDGEAYPQSRFFIQHSIWKKMKKKFDGKYVVAWRSLTSATNRRTMLATILPLIPTCQSIQILQLQTEKEMLRVLAVFNSIVFDYIVRLKMAGLDLTQTIIKQIPMPAVERFEDVICLKNVKATIETHINSRICKLYEKDIRLNGLFEDIETYKITEDLSRKEMIADIDYLVAQLYGLDRQGLRKIAYSFDKYYNKEEVENWF